jgi:hypothetical protein
VALAQYRCLQCSHTAQYVSLLRPTLLGFPCAEIANRYLGQQPCNITELNSHYDRLTLTAMFNFAREHISLLSMVLSGFIVGFPYCAVRAEDTLPTDSVRNFSLMKASKDQHVEPIVRPPEVQTHASPLARALEKSKKKGLLERGVEASTKALIDCQEETSTTYTMASGSGDAQQAHCLRF